MESRYLTSALLPKRLSCSASRGPALVFAPFLSLRSAAKLRHLENDTLTYIHDWWTSETRHRRTQAKLRNGAKTKAGPLEAEQLSRFGNIALVR